MSLQVVSIICGLILPRVIIQSYGSEVNGLVASIVQFLSFISLLDGGIGLIIKAALYKPIAANNQKEINKILYSSQKFIRRIVLVFLIYLIGLCVFYPQIFSKDFDRVFTIILIIVLSISSISEYLFGMVYRLFIEAKQRFYIISVIQMAVIILNTIISVTLINLGANIQIVKLSTAFLYLLKSITICIYAKKKFNLNIKEGKSDYKLRDRWSGLMQHTAFVIHDNTDVVVLTFFSNAKEISVYSVYQIVIVGIKGVIQSFSNGLDSIFGEMFAKDERKNLKEKLLYYEMTYFTIITIIFACAFSLITPFVVMYTAGIHDANYDRQLFGYIMILAEFMWAVRQPYGALVASVGHFKETKNGAIIEAVLNAVISIALVVPLGIVGVAIGTLCAMAFRTFDFIIYTAKHILLRDTKNTILHIVFSIIQIAIVFVLFTLLTNVIPMVAHNWIIGAICCTIIATFVVCIFNILAWPKEAKATFCYIAKKIKGEKNDM